MARCMASLLVALVLAASFAVQPARAGSLESTANPIRKVVTLLQTMQKKVEEEGKREKELYDKFMCYCKSGSGDLSASISTAEGKIPSVGSEIEASEGRLTQTKEDLKQAQADRVAAKDAMAEATAIREKEAAAFASEKAEADTNIAAISKAVNALEKGMSGGFLQTDAAQVLRRLAQGKQEMIDMDRQELLAFLDGTESDGYAPQSGDITGILKEMLDTMSKGLADATAEEKASIQAYEEMMSAKSKEVAALTNSIESKTKSIGDLGVKIVQMKEDLSDTQAALLADQKFLKELESSCSTKTSEWEERSKTRADELVALAETIKVLNDDDALDLFKKTLPGASASFVQLSSGASKSRGKALDIVRTARQRASPKDRAALDLIALALSGKKALAQGGFDKVIKMVDDMVNVLKKEQKDDDDKKEYCGLQLDSADDKKKGLERTVQEEENSISEVTEALATLKEDMATLEEGIKALDKSVAEATEQRKAENVEYKDLMAQNSAAKQVLNFAKNRLNKFYNPKLYKAAPKRELTREERIFANMGGTEPPTEAPGGIADTGIAVLAQVAEHVQSKQEEQLGDAPAPPPETWDAYSKKSEENNGVIAMIDLLIKDLEKEMTEAETEEKSDQATYEETIRESAAKRAADSKLLAEKGSAKADAEIDLEKHKGQHADAVKEHMATVKYISSLHSECDWLMQYFDTRKEARAGEIDSLQKAKAILSGADYSLLQTMGAKPRGGATTGFLQQRTQ